MKKLRKVDWFVKTADLAECKRLVELYHYSASAGKIAVYRHGLFRKKDNALMGCALWLPPIKAAAVANYDGDFRRVLSLTRLVIVPNVPKNAASYLIAQSIKLIKRDGRYDCLLTYADEWQGHTGSIYRATNWEYLGKTKPTKIYTLNGKMISVKCANVNRSHQDMLDMGCEFIGKSSKHKYRMVLR